MLVKLKDLIEEDQSCLNIKQNDTSIEIKLRNLSLSLALSCLTCTDGECSSAESLAKTHDIRAHSPIVIYGKHLSSTT